MADGFEHGTGMGLAVICEKNPDLAAADRSLLLDFFMTLLLEFESLSNQQGGCRVFWLRSVFDGVARSGARLSHTPATCQTVVDFARGQMRGTR